MQVPETLVSMEGIADSIRLESHTQVPLSGHSKTAVISGSCDMTAPQYSLLAYRSRTVSVNAMTDLASE